MSYRFNIGDPVILLDDTGEYECRGAVVGRYAGGINLFDIQPSRAESLAKRICGVPEHRLRGVAKPILAYERKTNEPKHIYDEA